MPNGEIAIELEKVISALIVLLGGVTFAGTLSPGVAQEIARVVWPLSLIAAGIYGLLLHSWRQRER